MNFIYLRTKVVVLLLLAFVGMITSCGGGNSNNTSRDIGGTQLGGDAISAYSGLLVKYKNTVSYERQQAILKEVGLVEVYDYSFLPGLLYTKPMEGRLIEDSFKLLKGHDSVVYVEPDYKIHLNKKLPVNKSAIQNKLQLRAAEESVSSNPISNESYSGAIAILDTGTDVSHKDLSQNMWINAGEIPLNNIDDDHNGWVDDIYGWNFSDNHNNVLDNNNHGTHLAGIVTGHFNDNSDFVERDIKLVTLKVLDENGEGKISSVLGAFDYIIKNNISISTNSWNINIDSQALKDALQQLSKFDHLLIVSAGDDNTNLDQFPMYPASYAFSNLLTVAALDATGNLASFSNYGKESVHLSAIGSAISSTAMNHGYVTASGTSTAAAFVSGIAVRVKSKFKEYSAYDVKNWLVSNAEQDASLSDAVATSKISSLGDILLLVDPGSDPKSQQDTFQDGTVVNNNEMPGVNASPTLSVLTNTVSPGGKLELNIVDGIAPYSWVVDDPTVGAVDQSGVFSALAEGVVTIYVTDSNNTISNEIVLTVTSMKISPENFNQLSISQRIRINADGGVSPYFWSISDSSVASISVNPNDDAEIEIIPRKTGVVKIVLQDDVGNRIEKIVDINILPLTVNRSVMSLDIGESFQLSVLGGSSPYKYVSQDETVASVDLGGYITANNQGDVTVIVSDAEGQKNNVSITVNPNFSARVARSIISVNETINVDVSGSVGVLNWASTDSSIITVDANGLITAISPGLARINVMDSAGRTGSLLLEVRQLSITAPSPIIVAGDAAMQLRATGGASPYTWSLDNNIATISKEGLLTGFSSGMVQVTATDADGFTSNLIVTVEASELTVNQTNIVIANNSGSQLVASGGDGNYSWVSNNENVAMVDNLGYVSAVSLGNTDVVLTDTSGQTKTISVIVQEIGLIVSKTNLLITEPGLLIEAVGGTPPYNWSTSDSNIASIDTAGFLSPSSLGEVSITVIDDNLISASILMTVDVNPLSVSPTNVIMDVDEITQFVPAGGDENYFWTSEDSNILVVDDVGLANSLTTGITNILLEDGVGQSVSASVEVRELSISAPSMAITVGDDMQLAVFDGGEEGVNTPYSWASSNTSVAIISNSGLLTAIAGGTVTITVTDTDGISTSQVFAVKDAALKVNTNNLILSPNETYSVIASGGDGNYSWSSSDPTVASANNGLITALSAGTSTIILTDGVGQIINIYVEVRSIVINASVNTLTLGQAAIQLDAQGGAAPYIWMSDNSAILSVDQAGSLLALNVGTTNITVTDQDGFTSSLQFTVNEALSVNKSNATLAVGSTLAITASGGSGNYTWASSNPLIASVSSSGVIIAESTGSAMITVTDSSGQVVAIDIDVSSFSLSASQTTLMVTDDPLQVEAVGGVEPYNWSVDDSSVASISASGVLTPINKGTVVITVTDANNNTGSLEISVNVEILSINTTNVLVRPGDVFQLSATGGDNNYTWSSQNSSIASIDDTGKISAVSSGKTTINLSDGVGQSVAVNVEVRQVIISSKSTSVTLGDVLLLTASGGAAPYTWGSANSNILSISASGLITANSVGSTIITVTDSDGYTATKNINVNVSAMTIDKISVILGISDSLELNVSGGDGNYVWSSSNSSVASVSSNGEVTASSIGISVITVRDGLGNTQNTAVEVRRVSVTGSNSAVVGESNLQLNVSGGNAPYNWITSNSAIATVNSSGQVTALAAGTVTISAMDMDGFIGSHSLSIALPALSLSQTNVILNIGQAIQFSATGGDGNYSWSSSNASVVSIDSNGLLLALSAGSAVITLTDNSGNSQTASVQVLQVLLSASTSIITIGESDLQLNVSGGMAPYTWSSNNTSVATVNTTGQVSGLSAGIVVITVTDSNGFSSEISLSIEAPVMTIDQTNQLIGVGDVRQLTVTGGDGNYSWSSSNTSIATVSSSGVVTANSAGVVTISVRDGLNTLLNVSIEVREITLNSSSNSLVLGASNLQVNASGGATPYVWSSSNTSIATVNENGQVTAISAGTITITATDVDGFGGSILLTVTVPTMTISQTSALLRVGDSVQLSANGGDGNFTWSSSNNSVVSVSGSGSVTANARGNAIITVTDGFGTSRSVSIEVRRISLTASTTSVTVGASLQINAAGGKAPYSWRSSNTSVASVNGSGQLTAIAQGNVTITATDDDGFSGTISITVNAIFGGGGMGH